MWSPGLAIPVDASLTAVHRRRVHADTLLALASLAMVVWEARRVRRGERHARTLFSLFLLCAAGFTAFAVHGWINAANR